MTNSPTRTMRPFLARFAQPLPAAPASRLRYDRDRQISQVFVDGFWIDALDVPVSQLPATRCTKVAQETTDDE